ncbi:hypothetical protein FIV42_00605 [Persicimonas caeni]|uniref:Uncharacterized protein n=1 Tax=Persicimonas caeni TaxID=2292766 RepID=A0A4Y6PLT3_PERCE|nr:hypothetical protein [Persicimonas caeni]QDG49284.1 hypothetical protein FIV42_00605 [Persicimonas caeni]QED30505.1 hypothetical protein FRD00_00600 [Persicimonas caeni]
MGELPRILEDLFEKCRSLENELSRFRAFIEPYKALRPDFLEWSGLLADGGEPGDLDQYKAERDNVLEQIQGVEKSYRDFLKSEQGPKYASEIVPRSEKQPKIPDNAEFDVIRNQKPTWRFHRVDPEPDQFGFVLDKQQYDELLERLRSFEQRTWNEILFGDRGSNHFTALDKIVTPAHDRLKALKLDMIDQLVQLRINGPTRLWGFFAGDSPHLNVLWYDPDHFVFDSKRDQ